MLSVSRNNKAAAQESSMRDIKTNLIFFNFIRFIRNAYFVFYCAFVRTVAD